MSLLHCGLSTQQEIAEEEDVIWEWNKLFTEVVSILAANKEQDTVTSGSVFSENEATFSKIKSDLGGTVNNSGSGITTSRRERGERNNELPF